MEDKRTRLTQNKTHELCTRRNAGPVRACVAPSILKSKATCGALLVLLEPSIHAFAVKLVEAGKGIHTVADGEILETDMALRLAVELRLHLESVLFEQSPTFCRQAFLFHLLIQSEQGSVFDSLLHWQLPLSHSVTSRCHNDLGLLILLLKPCSEGIWSVGYRLKALIVWGALESEKR